MREAEAIMANSLLVMVSIWFAVNVLFVALRLWVTRPNSSHLGAVPHQLSPVRVKRHLHRQV
jgi:hypothetical protein